MKIIILGASGQIGSVIYNGLYHQHEVIGTSRNGTAMYFRFDPFRDDWSSLGKADVVINCIGQIHGTKASSFDHIHVGVTKQIINNHKRIGNPRVIQISALGASVDHKVEFLRTKGIADELLLQHENTTVVRPSIVCTHRTMIVRKMLLVLRIAKYTAGSVFVPKGFLETRIQPVLPDDLIDAIQALCTKPTPPKVLDVVGARQLSFRNLIVIISAVSGTKLKVVEVSRRLMDPLVVDAISRLLPGVITSQQYQLLFEDNIADASPLENLIDRQVMSSEPFFINEFQHAED